MKSLFEKITTWRERIGQAPDFPLHVPTDVERAMVAEIADLRAAQPVCTAPPSGWYCTREDGHEGPCAAHHIPPQPADEQWIFDLAAEHELPNGRRWGHSTFNVTGLVEFAKSIDARRASQVSATAPALSEKDTDALAHFECLANAATQGDWEFGCTKIDTQADALEICRESLAATDYPIDHFYEVFLEDGRRTALVGNGPMSAANAEYIAALRPSNVLYLIALARRASEDLPQTSAAVELARGAVGSIAWITSGHVHVNWMRPERIKPGTLLYCAVEPVAAQSADKPAGAA